MKVTGNTLIELGYEPAKWFGEVIGEANNKGFSDIEDLVSYIDTVIPPEPLKPFSNPVKYYKNIEADNEQEYSNLQKVFETMDEVMKTPTVVSGAVMPDACPAGPKGQIPVGGVVVTRNAIHPAMHSADICCSVMATNLGKVDPKTVLDKAHQITHFGIGGREEFSFIPSQLRAGMRQNKFLKPEKAQELSITHTGTQGDGNHFLFVGVSELTGDTYMVTHHGSRGLGAYLYKSGLKVAERYRKELSPETLKCNAWIPYDTEDGKEYWSALQYVREWTKHNHMVLHETVNNVVNDGKPVKNNFWNEHNFVFKEGDLFYHAKGATPLLDNFVPDSMESLRLIPLNMSEPVLVVKGSLSENNLGFAPHGAGRNMSRSAHKRLKEGMSNKDIFNGETRGIDARFFSGKIDISELPSAYKNADEVVKQVEKFGLGEVVDRIQPYGCIMAGHIDYPWTKKVDK